MTSVDALAPVLSAEFEPAQVLHFEGRGGRVFDYIEDETVMDRLDEALGLGAASFEFSPVTDTCVKGRMTIRWPDETTSVYEDFGYATRADSAEPFKEAVSDAIRRLGRYVGVARYLYRKHDSPVSGGGRGPSSPARPSAPTALPTRGIPTASVPEWMPEEPADLFADREEFAPIAVARPGDTCEEHGTPWGGTPGDLWHGPKGIVESGYCRHPGNTKKTARRA